MGKLVLLVSSSLVSGNGDPIEMSESSFWPAARPLDDPGTESSSHTDHEAFGLQLELGKDDMLDSCSQDITARVKVVLENNRNAPTNQTVQSEKAILSKATQLHRQIKESFPLADRSVFYSKLLQKN